MKNGFKLRNLSIAALVGLAGFGATNSAQANETPITPTLGDDAAYLLTETSDISLDNVITKFIFDEATSTFEEKNYQISLKPLGSYGDGSNSKLGQYSLLGNVHPLEIKYNTSYGEGVRSEQFSVNIFDDDVEINVNYGLPTVSKSYNYGSVTNKSSHDFVGNSSLHNISGNTILIKDQVYYNNSVLGTLNSTTSSSKTVNIKGGAIYNDGEITNISADYVGNYVTGDITKSVKAYVYFNAYGGAVYNNGTIGDITGNFISNNIKSNITGYNNNVKLYGGAIYNNGDIGNVNSSFLNNYISSKSLSASGGAIYNASTMLDITGDFIGNSILRNDTSTLYNTTVTASGGAIYNGGSLRDITGDFIGNIASCISGSDKVSAKGGAIYNNGIIRDFYGNFLFNGTLTEGSLDFARSYGGAIYNNGRIENITGDFIGNYSESLDEIAFGGAIYNYAVIGDITGDFIGNYSKSSYEYASGGAISNDGTINNIDGDFIANYAQNSSYASGGAISNDGNVNNIVGDFIENYTQSSSNSYGGAISNGDFISVINGDFIKNYTQGGSRAFGGAIYNSYWGKIQNLSSNFILNGASINSDDSWTNPQGGAIWNSGTVNNIDGDFIANYAQNSSSASGVSGLTAGGAIYNEGIISNIDGDFIANYVQNSGTAYGGAIYNNRTIDNVIGDFIGNYVNSDLSSAYGGAIYNNGDIGNVNGLFLNNYISSKSLSVSGGAIYNDNSLLTIVNSSFINNYAKSENGIAQGGAIYNLGNLNILAKDGYTSIFSGNYTESSGLKDDNAIMLVDGYSVLNFNLETGGNVLLLDSILAKGNGVAEFCEYNWVSSFEEYVSLQGFKDTPTDTFLSFEGYSTVDEFVKNDMNLKDTAIETFLSDFNYASVEEAVNDIGFETVEAFLSEAGYNSFDEFLKNEMGLYGNTAEEQFLFILGYDSFDEFLKNETGLYGNSATEQFLYSQGYKSVEEYLSSLGYGLPTVNIQGDDINNTTFYLYNDIRNANVNIGNTTINTVNNLAHTYNFNRLTLTADTNMVVDVDLANKSMDRFSAKEYGEHQGKLNVTGMNLLSDAAEDTTKILFAENGLKDNVTTTVTEVAYTPIYKYNVSYDKSGEDGYFVFTRPTSSGSGGTGSAESFNPAVLGSSSAATVGATATMNNAFNYSFQHSSDFMNIPYLERISMRDRNKYAISVTGDATDMGRFSPLYQPSQEEASVWVKPYATFETVGLKNGPKVHNNTYGTLIGFDTEMQQLRRGWDRVFTGYIGYNGASQRYSGIDSTQNGGLLGGTMTLYKGNFFNATTVSVGASVANNQTMYGNEDFAMLLSGIGNKTGYNFEFKEGKLILQPSMLMSYTFVNTFDYTNAAGVRIDNKPLHALQLAPGVKVIGNLKDGWQPYASVQMVWNLMGESNATANGVKLPEMSIKPYVQYGVGVQKRIKDHFTAYGQAMVQNGGRNGVSLTAGFRWALGHDNCKYKVEAKQLRGKAAKSKCHSELDSESINANKTLSPTLSVGEGAKNEILRSAQNDMGKYTDNKTSSLDIGGVMPRAAEHKKILKQMTPEQKMAHGGKYYNTSRTAKTGSLRQY